MKMTVNRTRSRYRDATTHRTPNISSIHIKFGLATTKWAPHFLFVFLAHFIEPADDQSDKDA